MKKVKKTVLLLFFLSTINNYSQNLITNGDFGIFNASILTPPPFGYQTSYNQIAYNAGASIPRKYAITNDSHSVDTANFKNLFDHTTADGTGNMMFVDGQSNEIFWKQDPNLQLQAGVTYVFTFWVINVNRTVNPGNPAPKIKINPSGCTSCTPQIVDVGLFPSSWTQVTYSITPLVTQWIRIELSTVNAGAAGNNFAIDDVSLVAPPAPLTISISKLNPTCPAASDATIVAYPNGGVAPYTFALAGASTATNSSGIFQGLSEGSYTVSVTDSNTPPSIAITQPISIVSPLDITLSSSSMGCNITGSAITLTAANGGTTYNWSASTGIPILDTDDVVVVNPQETTTYTVISTTSSLTKPNLIENGDFESGTSGFFSDYGYSTSNTSGAQFAYGVVSNPKNWFVDFVNSADHSGLGMMLVADGATKSDKVIWSQSLPVENNNPYTLSFWAQNLVANSPAQFQVLINEIPITVSPISATNGSTSGWTQITGTWNSTNATIATIKIIDKNIIAGGNDFALDDISFSTPTPKTCNLSAQSTVTIGGITPITDFSYPTPVCRSGTNPKPTPATSFVTGGIYSELTGLLSINSTTGEIDLIISPSGTYMVKYSVEANLETCQRSGFSTFYITIDSTLPPPAVTTPVNYCLNASSTALSATALSGATLNWYGTDETGGLASSIATVPSTTAVGSNTYFVSQSIGVCESSRAAIVITISDLTTPSFSNIPTTVCSDSTISSLPATSTNGITGTWLPATINNTETTIYKFSPDLGQCATTTTLEIVVNPNVIPTFNPIVPICSGATINQLPTTSNNSITGVWVPALNNTATTTYTFSPASGQCATTTTLEIVVNPNIIPTFNPIAPICSGGFLSPLPNISNNNIIGTWLPTLDNTSTKIYTFTPDIGQQCATTQTLIIVVNSIPEFTIDDPECVGTDYILSVVQNGTNNLSYIWFNSQGEKIGSSSSIKITEKGNYSVEVKDGECKTSKNIEVNNVYCGIQKGISPNGDNKNDFFDLRNFSVDKLEIFNRYGVKVYNKPNYKNEWEGISDTGQELPDGTYYYIINFNGGNSKTGWVYINREQ